MEHKKQELIDMINNIQNEKVLNYVHALLKDLLETLGKTNH